MPAYLNPAYANEFGTGERRFCDLLISTDISQANVSSMLIDGLQANGYWWFGGQTGRQLTFQFPYAVRITEVTWYQDSAGGHGVWKWQGSDDGSSWADVSAPFTLGASATDVHDLSGNAAHHTYYRLQQVSGSTSAGPYIREVEFKIDQPDPYPDHSYLNPGGQGDRRAMITVTSSSGTTTGALSAWVDGNFGDTTAYIDSGVGAGKWVQFDFGAGNEKVFSKARCLRAGGDSANGTWKFQGSNDGASWTDLSSPLAWTLGDQVFPMNVGVTTAFRYLRGLITAGSTAATAPFVFEWVFDLGASAAGSTRRRMSLM